MHINNIALNNMKIKNGINGINNAINAINNAIDNIIEGNIKNIINILRSSWILATEI